MWKTIASTLVDDALTSKKFLVGLATVIALIVNAALKKLAVAGIIPNIALDPTAVYGVIAVAATYLLAQGVADHGKPATEKQVQLGAVLAMDSGPEKVNATMALAGFAPASIKTADKIEPQS